MLPTQLLIDGHLVTGEGLEESLTDPATGQNIGGLREASAAQVDRAVAAGSPPPRSAPWSSCGSRIGWSRRPRRTPRWSP
jgi:acyl-CoA reductase-like NAD-dependent aldehyde dehydrogenase